MRGVADRASETGFAHRVVLRVPPTTTAPRVAREAVAAFEDLCDAEVLEHLRLVLSELVTNSVRHADLRPDDVIVVRVSVSEGRLTGSVYDPGEPFGGVGASQELDHTPGGLGLHIVSSLTRDWGIREGDGNEVWFEL